MSIYGPASFFLVSAYEAEILWLCGRLIAKLVAELSRAVASLKKENV